ncbi:hypothetical protein BHE74_00026042 [Ensete ventricosum]|uniref:Uncharacterized protein n=1 Tax=Ensete ventricosum TaxID=4639 RepID=A0A427ATX3_ENSVE|nr:hypothetical protein B296_00007689 [Ensete ventricosum]RWW66580.1 hypothetical protein BHE74_00026042 [Ensete ventricosum]
MTPPPPTSLSAAPLRFHLLASAIRPSFPPKCRPVAARNLSIRRRFRSSCAFAAHSPPPSADSQVAAMGYAHCQVRRGFQPPFPPHPASPDPPQLSQPRLRQQGRPSRRPLARELLLGRLSPLLNHEFDDGIWMCVWQGMLTGLLGNMTLLSYFAKKEEAEAILVQTLGVVSIYVVLGQLAMAEAMSLPYFAAISVLVVSGLVLNFVNYFGWLHKGMWQLWEDFITVAGISVLPQVSCSKFQIQDLVCYF